MEARGKPRPTNQAFGRSALVTLGTENVFLTKSCTRRLLAAAGCRPVADAPYNCEIGAAKNERLVRWLSVHRHFGLAFIRALGWLHS